MKKILLLLFPFLIAIFLFHYFLVGQAVYGDGIYYWSYVRSFYIDHDLRLNDEISHQYDHVGNNTNIMNNIPKEDATRVALEYHLPFGASVGWLPFFALGDGMTRIVHIFNPSVQMNGYSDIYQITVGIGNILFVLMGLYFVYILLRTYFTTKVAKVTTILLLCTTNVLYYGSWDVVNSHPFSFFLSSILVYFFFVKFAYKWYQWIFLGALVGFLVITRTQEIVFGVFILAALTHQWISTRSGFWRKIIVLTKSFLLAIAGAAVVLFPQVLLLYYAFHGVFNSPYILSGTFHFLMPQIIGVLINSKTGLLFTSPIIIVGVVGLALYARQKKYIASVGLALFLLEYYVIASWSSWDQAASYGIRMLISSFPIAAIGLAYSIQRGIKKFSIRVVYMLGLVLFLCNIAMIIHFHLNIKTATKDQTTITRIEAQGKINTLFHTHFQFFKDH